ncbi:Anion exchange protein [Plakobranchus ocellatus]|uniref:Anion exchange protein n=1 Tax=Plakobranchus ocellatus TaxID=259542 RepID=A0AAV3ZK49_9GAST|nr:Anion exchange protein [Plakobranchus ocellatus]
MTICYVHCSSQKAEEAIPLTSDQDDASHSLDSKQTSTSLSDGHYTGGRAADEGPPPPWRSTSPNAASPSAEEEAIPSTRQLRSINTEPVISRDSSLELQDDNVTRLSFLHDEKAEEAIPLTSDQDDASHSQDSKQTSTSLSDGHYTGGRAADEGPPPPWRSTTPNAASPSAEEEAIPSTRQLRSINTEPVISRDSSLELQDDNVTRLSFLHDEVEKMFEADWKLEVDTGLTTDPNTKDPSESKMCRESSKLALSEFYHVDEAEYSRHRRVSYPHIHQPLRSLSNKSLSKTNRAHREKRKHRKKKRKEKIRSFPSQSAIKSPTIVEEEESHADQDYYDSGSSSVSEEEEFEEEFDEQDTGVEPATVKFEPLLLPKDAGETEGNGHIPGPVASAPALNVIPATPSVEKMVGGSPEKVVTSTSPAVIPVSSSTTGHGSPSKDHPVGFYIGAELPSPSSEQLVLLNDVIPKDAVNGEAQPSVGSPGIAKENSAATWLSSLLERGDEREQSPEDLGSNGSETGHPALRPGWSQEPQVSERPANLSMGPPAVQFKGSPRKASFSGGKVTFVLGEDDDSSYPNSANNLPNMGRKGSRGSNSEKTSGGEEDKENEEDSEEKEPLIDEGRVWKRRHSSPRRRGNSEADVHSGKDHALMRVSSVEGSQSTRSSSRRKHHHHHQHFKQEDLVMRRQKGSEVRLGETFGKDPTETEEASTLYKADLEQMTSHRFEDQRGIRRHKIARSKGALHSIVHIGKTHQEKKPRVTKKFDHSPHEVFVELDELHFGGEDMWEWREKARWIKFEEDVEEGAERWGKPHVASLSFHSLLELRRGLEKGTLLLDLEATDLTSIIHNVVENMVIRDLVEEEVKGQLLRTLLLKHKHVSGRSAFLRRTPSFSNLAGLDNSGKRHQKEQEKGLLASLSQSSFGSSLGLAKSPSQASVTPGQDMGRRRSSTPLASAKGQAAKLEMVKVDVDNNMHVMLIKESPILCQLVLSGAQPKLPLCVGLITPKSYQFSPVVVSMDLFSLYCISNLNRIVVCPAVICSPSDKEDGGSLGLAHQPTVITTTTNSNNINNINSNCGTSACATCTSTTASATTTNTVHSLFTTYLEPPALSLEMTDKQTDGIHIGLTPVEQKKHVQDIMRRIPKGSEASTVLVGKVDFLKKPAMAFVRLAEGQYLDNLTEVPLPVRFLFILLGPDTKGSMDYHEVGRSLSTLMSNQQFHDVAYKAESREDLLRAINSFLDDSIVLPPGDWDHRTLLPITHMARKRAQMRRQKKQQMEEKEALLEKQEKEDIPMDPLKRTGRLFGGVVNDIRRRYPWYISDIKDAFNGQCIKTLFFIFFTCLSPCIAFGGLLSEKTDRMIGISETMLGTSLFGMIFSMFSGQPLLIIGSTGPVLVFEESLYRFCESHNLEFLVLRFWIGLWVCAITVVAVALEGSFLVRYVTRFTEEIFAILISLIFIYEVVKKLMHIFADHPLMSDYCSMDTIAHGNDSTNKTSAYLDLIHHLRSNTSDWSTDSPSSHVGESMFKSAAIGPAYNTSDAHKGEAHPLNQPNTALLSLILVFGTFLIAYFLRIFRNSKFLGRGVRRALGDFGVLISLACMVVLSLVMNKTYVQKLDITAPLAPTSSERGWFINPLGQEKSMPSWMPFGAILPACLIFILLFMETQITEMFINKKERKLKKGSGYHVDQLILGGITFMGGMLGMPYMCAAAVRTVAHVSALSEYSRTHAPGEKPQLLGVKEQRVTNFCVHLLIGLAVALGPILKEIPVPALFGIFLYLGVSTLSGVQMFERIKLLLMPVKYHPSVSYVRTVPTFQMHKFTLIQLGLLIFLLVVKSTAAALSFPLLLILVVPLRLKVISRFFTKAELEHLDKEEEELELDDEDDPDFYQQAHMPI